MFTSNSTAPWSSRRSSDSNGKFNIQQFEDVCLIQKCKCSIAMLVYQRVCVFLQKGPWLTYLLYRSFWVGCALYLMSWVPCSIVVQHQNTANVFCAVMKLATSSLSTTWSIGISPKHGTHPPPGIPYHEANAAPRHSNAHGHQDPMPQSGRENANIKMEKSLESRHVPASNLWGDFLVSIMPLHLKKASWWWRFSFYLGEKSLQVNGMSPCEVMEETSPVSTAQEVVPVWNHRSDHLQYWFIHFFGWVGSG